MCAGCVIWCQGQGIKARTEWKRKVTQRREILWSSRCWAPSSQQDQWPGMRGAGSSPTSGCSPFLLSEILCIWSNFDLRPPGCQQRGRRDMVPCAKIHFCLAENHGCRKRHALQESQPAPAGCLVVPGLPHQIVACVSHDGQPKMKLPWCPE